MQVLTSSQVSGFRSFVIRNLFSKRLILHPYEERMSYFIALDTFNVGVFNMEVFNTVQSKWTDNIAGTNSIISFNFNLLFS